MNGLDIAIKELRTLYAETTARLQRIPKGSHMHSELFGRIVNLTTAIETLRRLKAEERKIPCVTGDIAA